MRRYSSSVLIAVVAVSALLLALATVLLVARANDGARERREADRLAVATTIAALFDDWAADRVEAVTTLAARPASVDDAGTVGFEGAFVVGSDGTVVEASASRAALVGLERDARVVRAGLEQPSGPRVVVDPLQREPEVWVAAPVASGALVGVNPLETSGLRRLIEAADLPDGVGLAVTDPDGRVYRPGPLPESLELLGPDVAPASSRAPDGPGVREYAGEGEVPTVGAWAPFGDGWAVVLIEDAATFGSGLWLPAAAAAVPAAAAALVTIVVAALLLRAREQAQASADATKRAILAVTGHELRTPMTVMKGMVSMLERRGEALTPEKRAELLDIVATQTRKLEYLLERLISVGHLAAGQRLGARPVATEVVKVADRAVSTQRGLAPLHDIVLDAPADPVTASADPKVLEDTLLHLLDNAVRFSPGGGEVRVSVVPGRKVRIAVEDRGIGLPADRAHIFEAFQQGQDVNTRVEDEGGVGMGLYIVAQAMREMGGTVRAEDRDGGGARFVLELPQD